jgi:PAS domain S-box-containing protein
MMGLGAILATLLFRRFTWARRAAESRAAEERATSEARFRAVAQSANDAVVSADANGTIVFWNDAARRIFGYSEEEAAGQPVTMLVPERHRDACLSGLRRAGESGQNRVIGKTLELEGRRKDGSEFPLELSLASWSMGDQSFYTTMIRDITDRKRAEDIVRDREARLRSIVENVPAIVYTAEAGPTGRWLYVSPQVESLLGFSPEEWMADPGLWFRQIHPEDQPRVAPWERSSPTKQGVLFTGAECCQTSRIGGCWRSSSSIKRSTIPSPDWPTGRCSSIASSTRWREVREAARRSRCCSWTWTTSRPSTTAWATVRATEYLSP